MIVPLRGRKQPDAFGPLPFSSLTLTLAKAQHTCSIFGSFKRNCF